MDDILDIAMKDSVKKLTEFLNEVDDSHNIKFTYEVEQGGNSPFPICCYTGQKMVA